MLVNQHLELDHDSKGTVRLYNTYDMSPAAEVARDCTANGGGRATGKDGVEYRALGFIPNECWSFDPWLITAKRAQMAGDKAEFTKYVKKFFEVHPEYRPSIGKKYF